MIDSKQLKSLWVLGYNFWIHIFKSLIPKKKPDQVKLFKGYFQKDWITALRKEEIDQLYNSQQCTVCGQCQDACLPSWLSQGKFLGPEHLAACASRSQPEYISDADDFYRCTLCGKCEVACPEEVRVSDLAWLMRRWVYRVDPAATWSLFPEVKKKNFQIGNPFGREKVDAQAGSGGRVLFPGCRELALGDPAKWAALLKRLGCSARLVSGACCGGMLDEIGAEGLAPGLEKLLAQNPEEVITTCPHCLYSLKKKLPGSIAVKFIMELIPENMAAGKISGPVIYHDPCFLSRKNRMAQLPRNIIRRQGLELLEFSAGNGLADCCGGGGGLSWYDPAQSSRLAGRRVEEAKKLGAKMILTECGVCRDLLEKAGDGKIEVKRLSELFL